MALPTPSPTLYITNLETKTKKTELRQQLYAFFNPYGRVIDVVAKKHGAGGRGQAFVVFEEQAAATAALRGLTGEEFYGRSLRISYAKTPSRASLILADPSAALLTLTATAANKTTTSRAEGEYEALERAREDEVAGAAGAAGGEKRAAEEGAEERESKRRKEDDDEDEMEIEMEDDEDVVQQTGVAVVVSNLPAECSEAIIGALFAQQAVPGYARATLLPPATAPASHPAPNAGSKTFRAIFDTREHAQAAADAVRGYEMQPGWNVGASVE
ncbi:hypothetical protein Q5752_002888 [Cryptotrichosporon argae]